MGRCFDKLGQKDPPPPRQRRQRKEHVKAEPSSTSICLDTNEFPELSQSHTNPAPCLKFDLNIAPNSVTTEIQPSKTKLFQEYQDELSRISFLLPHANNRVAHTRKTNFSNHDNGLVWLAID